MKLASYCLSLVILAFIVSCSSTASQVANETTGLRLNTAASFTTSASAFTVARLLKSATTAQCADLDQPVTQDDPVLEDGLDCDDDDGIVAHVTPSRYAIAFKRISLIPADVEGEDAPQIDFVADTGTLGQSEVVAFTTDDASETVVTINPDDLSAGTYAGIEVEIYYYQMTFPIGGTTRNVRIYMSDDDFDSEAAGRAGLGPHHQGDITFVDDSGIELGWIDSTWSDNLLSSRSDDDTEGGTNGAGGIDAETGHARGFFGNADLWDAENSAQGANQDIFVLSTEFSQTLEIPDPSTISDLTTITVTFSTADTFFYEDFAPQGTGFSPGDGGEATAESTAWAPLLPELSLVVE